LDVILEAVLILLWFGLVPYSIGMTFTGFMKRERDSFWMNVLCGYAGMFAFFEVLSLPLIFSRQPFHILKYSYGLIMLLWAGVSLFVNRKRIGRMTIGRIRKLPKVPWTIYLAVVLVAFQIGVYLFGMATDLDDSFYVASATTTLHTDEMFTISAYTGRAVGKLPSRYVLSPFPILLAFFSEAVRMHPAVVAHTVLPIFLVGLAYGVYILMGQRLFKGDVRSTGIFLCFLSLVHVFSWYSVYTQGTFMLIRIWQGKATLAATLLPGVFYMTLSAMKEREAKGEWAALFCLMTACCLVSSMGIMLAPIMLGILTIVLGIVKWKWKNTLLALACSVPGIICTVLYILIR